MISGGETFERIRNWMTESDLQLDTLYISNILEWVLRDNSIYSLKSFACLENLRRVSSTDTRVVHAYRKIEEGAPIQFVETGPKAIQFHQPTKKRNISVLSSQPTFTKTKRQLFDN